MSFGSLTRRELCSLLALPALASAQRSGRRPNVVVILTDDQGWGDLSLHGNTNLSTPNIDSLANHGAQFDRFFVCAVCAPTRAEFLTGRYHARGGVRGVSTGQERLNTDERTIAEAFRDAGYATGAFGKWHNGSQAPYHPNWRGFDEYYGFTSGHWAHYFDTEMDHNGRLTRGKGYITDDLTNHAIEFIWNNRARPFFCYLPLNAPHSPMQVPEAYYNRFASLQPKLRATDPSLEDLGMTRAALAMVENIDHNVGRLLDTLRRLDLEKDTIVLFFSDNGPNSWRWNGGMKGRKGSVDEGGVRSPLLIRWPGKIRPGMRIPQIAAAIDLLPTLTGLAGIPHGAAKPLDGRSLAPLLLEQRTGWPDRRIFSTTQQAHQRADAAVPARSGRAAVRHGGRSRQTRDCAAEKPAVAAELRKAAETFAKEVLPLVGPDDRPYPVGHGEVTYLPARDGQCSGGIRRSNRAPNASYFTNWKSLDGRIHWDIEVAQAGEYEAALYYTAPQAGSRIELSFGGARLEARIAPAHDPPLYGMKEDRHERGQESYAKDFRPLTLGRIRLAAQRGRLTLRAVEITGAEVADVRRLALTRK